MMAAHIRSWMNNDGVGGRVYSPTDVATYEREVCIQYDFNIEGRSYCVWTNRSMIIVVIEF